MMNRGLLLPQWRPFSLLPPPPPRLRLYFPRSALVPPDAIDVSSSAAGGGGGSELTGRERRKLRNERREEGSGSNWREAVEERLMHKAKKQPAASWTEKLNLDLLARLGPQWWVVRVSRVNGHETADRIARALARNFPTLEFKVYFPAVTQQTKLKNGSYSKKLKPLYPGCVFLHCVMNKEVHDFIREVDGIGGFVGSKVGNTKRQINRPKPVSFDEMEAIFKEAREEQKLSDEAFKEEQQEQEKDSEDSIRSPKNKRRRQPKEGIESPSTSLEVAETRDSLTPGASVRILSGPFAEFIGCIKELNHKRGKVTVGLKLFGKESFVDLEVDQLAPEAT